MSYIKDSLSDGENIRRIFEFHWIIKIFIVLHALLSFTIIWLPIAIFYWLSWKFTEQGVTNRRVIYKHGIISRKTDEMRLSAIESIVIRQGIWGRILGFGTVTITGRGAGDVNIRWVPDPMQIKREIENAEQAIAQREWSRSE